MSEADHRCDACGAPLPEMPPELVAQQLAAALARGDRVSDPKDRLTICDPCWQRAIAAGWKPGSN